MGGDGPRMAVLRALRRLFRLTHYHGWGLVEPFRSRLIPDRPIVARVEGSQMVLDLQMSYNWRLFKWGMDFAEEFRPFCRSVSPA